MSVFRFLTILCICFSILLQLCSAADTIALNESISGDQRLVSPGQRFELGFFSPGTSKNSYLAIRYKTTPDVIVWVANRNNPLTDSNGVFTISSNGTPVLLNSTNSIIWSANVSRVVAVPVIQLLHTGNLVLLDKSSTNSDSYLWQSFDYPGDTRLPGMWLGNNSDTGVEVEQYLTSWRNTDDPSPGDFIYKVENHGLPQLVLTMGTRKRFRSGPWNGIRFNGLPMLTAFFQKKLDIYNKEGSFSLSDRYDNSVITRLTLNKSGSLQRYILDGKNNVWNQMYSIPNNECDNYGNCGPNSVCNTNTSPMCQCLKGFTPKSQQEWELLNWSGGCVRIEPPNCENGDGFLNVSGVKLPDLLQFQLKKDTSLSECEAECLRDCSCTAYTNPYVSVGNNSCLMWYGDLVDIRVFAEEKNEQTVYVRVPKSEIKSTTGSNVKKKSPLRVILISTASGVLFLGLVCGCIVLKIKRKRKELRRKEDDLEVPIFDLATIAAATRSFSHENRIGQGGFGPVYKGNLSMGQEIAVKRLSNNSGQGAEEFKSELVLIAKLQHRNLVRLLGCCIQGEERMLIYEYMQNESLDHFLFDSQRSELLIWPMRFDIIMGIARGLLYLHQDSRLKIIHRDLKTSNILLGSNLEPKISDFGLARILEGDQTFVKTKRVIGTYGYMAPEYAIDGKFSDKSDIFSFGVLLLEIVSGKKNRSFSHPDHRHHLLGHAWLLWNEDRALELMDERLKDSFVKSQVQRCIQVGLLCVQRFAEDRPPMSFVLFMLGNEGAILPQPEQPGFFTERSSGNVETHASGREECNSGQMVTITQLVPR